MRIVLFCHSLLSDWNHGNAHFLRGVCSELAALGHDVRVYEPANAWSAAHLVAEHGEAALAAAREVYPLLNLTRYDERTLDLDEALDAADLVIVHEWNTHTLVARVGRYHLGHPGQVLLFHDTHHRSVSDTNAMAEYDLAAYDGVLAFGNVVRERYLATGWASRAWTWHEAADTHIFHPRPGVARDRDLVWIGNWGDDERTRELHEFLTEPARRLGLRATVHGVRYPPAALRDLAGAGIAYEGWLPNFRVPDVFAHHRVTVHIPRRPYTRMLPGIPTIRPFEALACGIPLVSAPWDDAEGLFTPGADYLVAADGAAMTRALREVLADPAMAHELAARGRRTIESRHTCAHRACELLAIHRSLAGSTRLEERVLPV
jgi:spore maturation protein CgeB